MKIELRLSFFFFQFSEKMNDSNVHVFKLSSYNHCHLVRLEDLIRFVFSESLWLSSNYGDFCDDQYINYLVLSDVLFI